MARPHWWVNHRLVLAKEEHNYCNMSLFHHALLKCVNNMHIMIDLKIVNFIFRTYIDLFKITKRITLDRAKWRKMIHVTDPI